MEYSTLDYLKDIFAPVNYVELIILKIRRIGKKLLKKAVDADYPELIVRIVGNLPYGFLIVYLGIIVSFFVLKANEEAYGTRFSVITTNSMSPAIKPGSLITASNATQFRKGDIVTFRETDFESGTLTGRVLTHRIIDIKESGSYFITKGDANSYPDPGITDRKYILGKVRNIIPYAGYFYLLIKTLPGFLVFIILPVLIIIRNELIFLKKQDKATLRGLRLSRTAN